MTRIHKSETAARAAAVATAALTLASLNGCIQSGDYLTTDASMSSAGTVAASSQSAMSLAFSIQDPTSGSAVFDSGASASSASAIRLQAGRAYRLKIDASNAPADSSLNLVVTNMSMPAAIPVSLPARSGSALSFTPPVQGDYQFQVQILSAARAPMLNRAYAASVSCQSPTFTADSLNPSGISVSGSNNLYTYSAANVVAGANGQAPYQCAFDLTGAGIVDTGFQPCGQSFTSQYSAYVGNRSIGVVVKDACNTAYTVSSAQNLAAATPASPGGIFVKGTISNESGPAATDPRVKGVNYLATNVGGHNIVQPSYGGSNFSIYSYQNYGHPSAVQFGMQVNVVGLGGTFNLRNNVNGTIDASQASVSSVSFTTDQAGDQAPTETLNSTSCTSSGIQARVTNPVGTPCASGAVGGSQNSATIEVWGNYQCTLTSGRGSSVTITGSFDGYQSQTDNCIGGGGSSGGGIAPVGL